jgi:hypothetical protein
MGCHVVLNMPTRAVIALVQSGKHSSQESEESCAFNKSAAKRKQAEAVLGCDGLSPIYASVTSKVEGDRGYGNCSLVLKGIGERTAMVGGDILRVRNPARADYVSDPSLVLYSYEDMADCRAAAAMLAIPEAILLAGPDAVMKEVSSPDKDYGTCQSLVFGGIVASDVARIVTDSKSAANDIRAALRAAGRLLPVAVSESPITVYGGTREPEDEAPSRPSAQQMHFKAGDRVTMKPQPSNPVVLGTIMDVANGVITIQWDDSQRAVYDMAEALMRVMTAPSAESRVDGMVVYSLPGMSDESALALSTAGVDPVTVYSVVSHARPASPAADWWKENLLKSLADLGLNAHKVRGYVRNDGPTAEAFLSKDWIEAKLPGGARLVIDVSSDNARIEAGEAEDYVTPSPDARIVFE